MELFNWQQETMTRFKDSPEVFLAADMGTGKTRAVIELLRYKYNRERRVVKTLILAPLSVCANWPVEFKKYSKIKEQDIICLSAQSNRKKSLKNFINVHRITGIIVMNYEFMIANDVLKLLDDWGVEYLVCDESHRLKSPQAKVSKSAFYIAQKTTDRILLTGTPYLNSAVDIYSQYKILDLGATFGKHVGLFKSMYMKSIPFKIAGRSFNKFEDKDDTKDIIAQKMAPKCIRVKLDDCVDLPPLIEEDMFCDMSNEQQKVYTEVKKDCVSFMESHDVNDPIVANMAMTKLLRLQQIVSGFCKTESGTEVEFKDVPRLDLLCDLLADMTVEHKVIVWCCFKRNYKMISERLTKMGISHSLLTGEQNAREKQESIESFTKGETKVLLSNPQSGGVGINLVESCRSIYYSRDFNLGNFEQSKARNYRAGSQAHSKVVHVQIITPKTVDEQTVEALRNKRNIAHELMNMIKGETNDGFVRS